MLLNSTSYLSSFPHFLNGDQMEEHFVYDKTTLNWFSSIQIIIMNWNQNHSLGGLMTKILIVSDFPI